MSTRLRPAQLVGITLAITVVGLVGGAAWAAPDEILPLAQLGADVVSTRTEALVSIAGRALASVSARDLMGALLGDRSPRRLGMLAATLAMVGLGAAALRGWWRARRVDGAPVRLPPTAVSPMPYTPKRRKAVASGTTNNVCAMAAAGSSPLEIARRSGLALDAVAMMLAIGESLPTPPTRN